MAFEAPILILLRQRLGSHIEALWPRHFVHLAPSYAELRFQHKFLKELQSHVNEACTIANAGMPCKVSVDTLRRLLDGDRAAGLYTAAKQAISVYLGYSSWEHFMREATHPPKDHPLAYEPQPRYGPGPVRAQAAGIPADDDPLTG